MSNDPYGQYDIGTMNRQTETDKLIDSHAVSHHYYYYLSPSTSLPLLPPPLPLLLLLLLLRLLPLSDTGITI